MIETASRNTRPGRTCARNPKILDIRIDDPVLLAELQTRDTLEAKRDYGEELMELGARVARTHRPVSEATQVCQIFEEQARRADERERVSLDRIDDHAETTRASLTRLKSRMRSEMSTLIATVNRDTEAQQRAIADLHQRTERSLKSLLEGVESGVERAGGDSQELVSIFKERLSSTLSDLRAQVERAEQVIASSLEREQSLLDRRDLVGQTSHRKGMEFETLVAQELASFGASRGDLVERVGSQASTGTSSKKGDVLYQMRAGGRLVPVILECKDEALRMSGSNPFYLADLETAMRERGAEFGVVVSTLDQNLGNDGSKFPVLQFFGDNQFVVLIDRENDHPVALETVMHLIHQSVSQKKLKEGATAIDLGEVAQSLQRLSETHSRFSSLKRTCTNLCHQVESMRAQLDGMDDSLDDQTDHLRRLLGLAA